MGARSLVFIADTIMRGRGGGGGQWNLSSIDRWPKLLQFTERGGKINKIYWQTKWNVFFSQKISFILIFIDKYFQTIGLQSMWDFILNDDWNLLTDAILIYCLLTERLKFDCLVMRRPQITPAQLCTVDQPSSIVFLRWTLPSICHRTYFHTSKGHVTWIIKKVNRRSHEVTWLECDCRRHAPS